MTARWWVVLAVAVGLIAAPFAVAAGTAPAPLHISSADLLARVQASREVAWSGDVETVGGLQVPATDSFTTLADLLGERTDLRVWWRGPEDWRVDRTRSTGETDLFRLGQTAVRWIFESETATISPVSEVRLPDATDLLPATLGRSMLQGVLGTEVDALPSRRIAGVTAAGLRLTPNDPASTVARVDVWAEPRTGLPVRVEVSGAGDRQPVLTTTLTSLDLATPDAATTHFVASDGVKVVYDQSVDVAAAANAFAPYDLPPSLGGLATRGGVDPGAVGIYGRGPTTMIVLPLRGQVAGPLRQRLRDSPAAEDSALGTLVPVGPVGLLMTARRGDRTSFLLAGTVSAATLRRAATELGAVP